MRSNCCADDSTGRRRDDTLTGVDRERLVTGGPVPSLLEVMDRTCIRAVEGLLKADLDRDAQALLLAQARG